MTRVEQLLNSKCLPDFYSIYGKDGFDSFCDNALKVFSDLEYGSLLPQPLYVKSEIVRTESTFCAGKAELSTVKLCVNVNNKDFCFPVYTIIPKKASTDKVPFFVHINFRDNVPDKYLPCEEIVDRGYAVLMFCYKDVTSDDGDFSNGLAGVLYPDGVREDPAGSGKIAMWSWAASRVLDYALTLDVLDKDKAVVVGHSRLGKTALLTGAVDKRFCCTISNDSGCCGAAIQRNKQGENLSEICKRFPFWFCENLRNYINKEHELPFDQYMLLTMCLDRLVYVASAEEDLWADPENEFLSCVAAAELAEKMGIKCGFNPENMPDVNLPVYGDRIGYHVRSGLHYFSRQDWNYFMDFLDEKLD